MIKGGEVVREGLRARCGPATRLSRRGCARRSPRPTPHWHPTLRRRVWWRTAHSSRRKAGLRRS